jgi:hypothetical protein
MEDMEDMDLRWLEMFWAVPRSMFLTRMGMGWVSHGPLEVKRCQCDCVKHTASIHLAISKRCSSSCMLLDIKMVPKLTLCPVKWKSIYILYYLVSTCVINGDGVWCKLHEGCCRSSLLWLSSFCKRRRASAPSASTSPELVLALGQVVLFFLLESFSRHTVLTAADTFHGSSCVRFSKYELDLAAWQWSLLRKHSKQG